MVGLLSTLVLGCGAMTCTNPPPQSPSDEVVAEVAPIPVTPAPANLHPAGEDDEILPAYNEAALAARVAAQKALLGDDIFEDIDGRPVSPRVEILGAGEGIPGLDGGGTSIDDDILLALPGSAGYGPESTGPRATPSNGNALGLYVPIEQPKQNDALAHFHAALRGLAEGVDPDGKVRVMIYGASHTQADVYPAYFRKYLQTRFGDGGMGFVSLARVNKWYRYHDWAIEETKGWNSEHAQRTESRKDGLFGLLGASCSSNSKRDRTRIIPQRKDAVASRYELHYLAQPGGGSLELRANGKKIAKVSTKQIDGKNVSAPMAGYHTFDLPEGGNEIEVRPLGDGEVRLFGLMMERDTPGVVVDTLGIAGTRAANMLNWNRDIWSDCVRRRDPDLIVLAYGTNEATDDNQSIAAYRADLREVLTRLKEFAPEASCVLVGPGDFPREVEEDVWVPRPRVLEIVAAQRDIAYEMGCGFWDTLAFMGGVNSMHEWATAQPQMASRDHIHFTKRGYVRLGMALLDAIMADFDRE